jgi:hypothetical protein
MSRFCALVGRIFVLALVGVVSSYGSGTQDPDKDFDRLDGTGLSRKKVDVIEWEGNLELHIYPKKSLAGLGLKIDRENKNRPVMVISYRFHKSPAPLIRRAVLSIPLSDTFKVYEDSTEPDFDKVVISNHTLATGAGSQLAVYRLDPPPSKLYPQDGIEVAKNPLDQGSPKGPEKVVYPETADPDVLERERTRTNQRTTATGSKKDPESRSAPKRPTQEPTEDPTSSERIRHFNF